MHHRADFDLAAATQTNTWRTNAQSAVDIGQSLKKLL